MLVCGPVLAIGAVGLATRAADATGVDTVDEISANYGDDASTSIWLHWRGAVTTVDYGTDSSYGSSAAATASPITPVDVTGPFEQVELTGLSAGTVYHYQIGPTGADHQFETAPTGDAVWDDIGDTGSTYYLPGSAAICNKSWMPSVWQQLAADNADVYTHGGDISYANECGNPASHQLFDDIEPVSTTRVIEWSEGNHEYGPTDATSPPGTVQDSLANYKGRWNMAHPQVEPNDTSTQTTHPGCSPAAGQTTNGCQGQDWGWFDVGHYRFISRPEPDLGALPDWQVKAAVIMADAEANPNIFGIITYGHRPACSSLKVSGAWASDPKVDAAVNALAALYSPTARSDGKYVLDVGHHIHGAEVCSAINGVWELTDGAGGSEEASYTTTNPASIWKSNHFSYIRAQLTGNQIVVNYICGPVYPISPTRAAPCTTGSTMYSLTITSPVGPTPTPTPTPTDTSTPTASPTDSASGTPSPTDSTSPTASTSPTPTDSPTPTPTLPPAPIQYVGNTSLETGLSGWTGVYNSSSLNRQVLGGYDGSYSLYSVNNSAATGATGFLDKPHWLTLGTTAGVTYTASAHVAADVIGEKFSLFLRELNPAGAAVGSKTVPLSASSTGWLAITAAYKAVASGDTLAYYLSASNVPAHKGFRADLLSLTAPAPQTLPTSSALLLVVTPMGGLLGLVAYLSRYRPRHRLQRH